MPITTDLELANAALAQIGADSIESLTSPETDAEEIVSSRYDSFYETSQANYPWRFTVTYAELTGAVVVPSTEFSIYTHKLTLPANILHDEVLGVFSNNTGTPVGLDWNTRDGILYISTSDDIWISYREKKAVSDLPQSFIDYMIVGLGATFAGGITAIEQKVQLTAKQAEVLLNIAQEVDRKAFNVTSVTGKKFEIINGAMTKLAQPVLDIYDLQYPRLPLHQALNQIYDTKVQSVLDSYYWNFSLKKVLSTGTDVSATAFNQYKYLHDYPTGRINDKIWETRKVVEIDGVDKEDRRTNEVNATPDGIYSRFEKLVILYQDTTLSSVDTAPDYFIDYLKYVITTEIAPTVGANQQVWEQITYGNPSENRQGGETGKARHADKVGRPQVTFEFDYPLITSRLNGVNDKYLLVGTTV